VRKDRPFQGHSTVFTRKRGIVSKWGETQLFSGLLRMRIGKLGNSLFFQVPVGGLQLRRNFFLSFRMGERLPGSAQRGRTIRVLVVSVELEPSLPL
jgi:hypothetical protein